MHNQTSLHEKELVANWQSLIRTFVKPENGSAKAALLKYMEQILFGLQDFLQQHVGITEEIRLWELVEHYKDTRIGDVPEKKLTDVITDLIQDIAPHAVNVASPYFVGHMTSAIPFFMIHLKTIVAALNQNVVKLETSKVASVIERQVIAKIHRLIYGMDEDFYQEHVQNTHTTLGAFTEGGTTANLTALWVARNAALAPVGNFRGVETDGLFAAYQAYSIDRSVVLISRRRHYSFRKAGGVLGIGNQNVIAVDVDANNRIDIDCLYKTIRRIHREGRARILAIVGVAGATETGTVDPLRKLAEISAENGVHFHVDAAWGGPTLTSEKYRYLLDGIDLARAFAREIGARSDFELITPPELNILTYRFCPAALRRVLSEGDVEQKRRINRELNEINIVVQRTQREAGNSFVSRTVLNMRNMPEYAAGYQPGDNMVVLRCVLMNPLTTLEILKDILDEQEEIYRDRFTKKR